MEIVALAQLVQETAVPPHDWRDRDAAALKGGGGDFRRLAWD